ncbi:MAG: GtrA family protein [Candidatus Omnitrophota bacterium]|jgi:putative flippase GtrA|nr:GtrA family protein [Candidatus Omnitrophota bacterium]
MIDRFFRSQSDAISVQMFRYVLSGAVACVVDYSMLVMLTQAFKLYYLTSAAIAFMLGATVSYILNIIWVFDRRAFADRRLEAILFFSIGIAGLFLNHYCIRFFTESAHFHYMASKVISTIAVFAVNFSARKYILFR